MPGPFDITGDLPLAVGPRSLSDVAGTLRTWEKARDAERAAMDMLREAVDIARQDGATLAQLAAELGRTRQYVQKILREQERRESDLKREARRVARGGHHSGWKGGQPQCAGCKRFLSSPDAICGGCGYAGHGGYVGVPATTSHLERYR